MTTTILSRLLKMIEESSGAFSVRALARELDVTPGRVEGMLEYWIRKGKIRVVEDLKDCGSCSVNGNCPFVVEMPLSYDLVINNKDHYIDDGQVVCERIW